MSNSKETIAIGGDEAGFALKKVIMAHLQKNGRETEDFGVYNTDPSLYPDVALSLAQAVADGKFTRGILICGTGIGVCITANKVPGIRASVCHDSYSTERARASNDCQIMTLGARVIGDELAKQMVDIFFRTDFDRARSGAKVDRISEIETALR